MANNLKRPWFHSPNRGELRATAQRPAWRFYLFFASAATIILITELIGNERLGSLTFKRFAAYLAFL